MLRHLMNVRVENQKLPKAVFRLANNGTVACKGQLVIRLKRVFQETFTYRVQSEQVEPGGSWLFFFEIPEAMERFYAYEWWWVSAEMELSGSGYHSGQVKTFKGDPRKADLG